jgi:double-stranded uracil-DNA glycosylase
MLDPKVPANRRDVLPDLLAPNLKIVFCGTAAGTTSARLGQYYAHRRNLFWPTLHAIGLTPRQLDPSEYRRLLQWRLGLTDIAKNASGMDGDLPAGSIGRAACEALRARIEFYQPAILAFTSLRGGRSFLGRAAIFGEQAEKVGSTIVWVLPSPSPAAHWNFDEEPWRALAAAIRSLT